MYQGLDLFQKSLCSCASDESIHSHFSDISRVGGGGGGGIVPGGILSVFFLNPGGILSGGCCVGDVVRGDFVLIPF